MASPGSHRNSLWPFRCCRSISGNCKSPAITELAESEASDQTTMSIAGHVSPKMLAHYSHVRLEAKRKALDSLSRRPAKEPKDGVQEGSYVTKNVTNDKSVGDPSP